MAKIKNVAIQMDHVSGINIGGDSTFAMSLEAQARGYRLFHYTPDRLSMRDGKIYVTVEQMELRDIKGDHFSLSEPERVDLSTMDVIHLRQDPPFDMAYITSTHLLERIHPKTLVVNDPAWVRNSPEKIFVTEFADLMPKTLITKDVAEIARFRNEMGDIILAALWQWRCGRLPFSAGRPQFLLAAGNVRSDVPRTLHCSGISARRPQGR